MTKKEELAKVLRNEGGMDLLESLDVASKLRRDAWRIQRHHERSCSDIRYDVKAGETVVERAHDRMVALLSETSIRIIPGSGDPRGFPVFLELPSGRSNDWGGRGFGIPN